MREIFESVITSFGYTVFKETPQEVIYHTKRLGMNYTISVPLPFDLKLALHIIIGHHSKLEADCAVRRSDDQLIGELKRYYQVDLGFDSTLESIKWIIDLKTGVF